MFEDTDPRDAAVYHALLDEIQPAERLAQAARLSTAVRTLALAGVRQRHPTAGPDELRWRYMALCYGKAFARRTLGARPGALD